MTNRTAILSIYMSAARKLPDSATCIKIRNDSYILKEMTPIEEREREKAKYLLAQFKGRQSLVRTGTASECISESTLHIKDKFEDIQVDFINSFLY